MLSLTARDQEIVRQFHGLHAEAAAASFGYMFRSPTLWEDLVKSITLCNCGWDSWGCLMHDSSKPSTGPCLSMHPSSCHSQLWQSCRWGRTLAMNSALCTQVGSGAFPSPAQVLRAGASTLQACGLGYRTKTLLRLAEQVFPPLHLVSARVQADATHSVILPRVRRAHEACDLAVQSGHPGQAGGACRDRL